MSNKNLLENLYSRLHDMYLLTGIDALLGWDQQVMMPQEGAAARSDQIELVSKLIHERWVDPAFIDVVETLAARGAELGEDDQVNVRETKRQLDKRKKLPKEFVAEKARASSACYVAWTKARPKSDFAAIAPFLAKNIELARQEAELLGYTAHAYDALLDNYEPGMTLAELKPLLTKLGTRLSELVPGIQEKTAKFYEVHGDFDEGVQQKLNEEIAAAIGYEFSKGRLDKTHHPFMTLISAADARITTRYSRENFVSSIFTVLHEAGHALYELGFRPDQAGRPLAGAVSLGIHESQSRLWENVIGRSRAFSEFLLRLVKKHFPGANLSLDQLWQSCNKVTPSLIRVEADEVTYSLHVVIRMLLEEKILSGDLQVKDLPQAWHEMYTQYLHLRAPDDKDGVLQDVHWYSSLIGYFPTYALGNLYGAMMVDKAKEVLGDLDGQVARGEFAPLLGWLRENVHVHGQKYQPKDLIRRITGKELSAEPFVGYIENKFR